MVETKMKMNKIFVDILVTISFMLTGIACYRIFQAKGNTLLMLLGLPVASLPMLYNFWVFGRIDILSLFRLNDEQSNKKRTYSRSLSTRLTIAAILILTGVFINILKILLLTISWLVKAYKTKGPLGIMTPLNVPLLIIIAVFGFTYIVNYENMLSERVNTHRKMSDLSVQEVAAQLKEFKNQLDEMDYLYKHPLYRTDAAGTEVEDTNCSIRVVYIAKEKSWRVTVTYNDLEDFFKTLKTGEYILDPGLYILDENGFEFTPYLTDEDYKKYANAQKSTATEMQKRTLLKKYTIEGMLRWSIVERMPSKDLFAKEIEEDGANYEFSNKKSEMLSDQRVVFQVDKNGDKYKLVRIYRGLRSNLGDHVFNIEILDITFVGEDKDTESHEKENPQSGDTGAFKEN